jgi:diguanylate cyclase (GGDEF)-like protein
VHDPLTGLLDRREFVNTVGRDLASRVDCAVLFCDLNGFKAVQDRLGHQAGGELLAVGARHLRDTARTDTVVGRFGRDEFVILVGDDAHAEIETDQRTSQRPYRVRSSCAASRSPSPPASALP